jgi:predicted P-loop ATPase
MSSDPDVIAPAEGVTAGATSEETQTGVGRDPRQRKDWAGSSAVDDPDRRRWEHDTVPEHEYVYHLQNGVEAFRKLKGRRSDGGKAFLTARLFTEGWSELEIAQQESPEAFCRHPDLAHYLKGAGDVPHILYALPGLARGIREQPDDPVFITEGEKDADTLIALGLIATTNPDGALKWKPEYNEWFRNRDVVVMIDNDPNGRKRGKMLAVALYRFAKSTKLVELPGLARNADVTDWLQTGKSQADLMAAVEATEVWEPFDRDDDGRPYRSPDNARLALDLLGVSVRYDEFADRTTVFGLKGFGPLLDDAAAIRLRFMVEERWRLAFSKEKFWDGVTDYARRNSFHPVRDYLDRLRWDGVPRLDGWLSRYGGAEASAYSVAVGTIPLIAAVRRVREPGCKFDELLVLEGAQGVDKSTALRVLAVRDEWFVDDLPIGADSKVVMEQISGCWIAEFAEMKGMKSSEVENVKSMVARQIDKARMAYGRAVTERPRQCVFFGTTNADEYLRDSTGNRRFWPIKVTRFDTDALRADRDQLWAEASAREADGESIRLPKHLWAIAGEHQDARMMRDPMFEVLSERLEGHEGKVRANDIWDALGLNDPARRTQSHNNQLHSAMHKLGWSRPPSKLRFDGRPQHAWIKGDASVEVPRSIVLGLDAFGRDGRPM